ncbi:MerR family transcriptional regulator [Methylomonas koyamae]|uniref:MerR family transcriptional regulator n=1 Tax=Methylomonas koyamae TaxID=702114 RepID=A0A291IK19_9GAMM|nr:B12-binding domain-containing protein [Methylomonas koyamae]ATG90538.1 MerR family transcriptional regulator [Methylomonas koyamae]OAI30059.1 MerR family transcriptional regulator [Methylomonas koyamae]
MYSIKAITSLTGLTPETLRAWERRYACVTPARNDTGRRFYSQQDLDKLTLLVNLTGQGHSIGKLAGLSWQQLNDLQNQSAAQQRREPAPFLEQIADALREYRIERCEQLLKKALLVNEPLDYARDVLLPAMQKVGNLWHQGKINIAQEHMFSSCVKRIVLSMVNNLHRHSRNNPAIMLATPSGEPHEFGILVSCLVAAAQNYNCYYLGADLPAEDILEAARHLAPELLVVGMVKTPPEEVTVEHLHRLLAGAQQSNLKVWLGGAGALYLKGEGDPAIGSAEVVTDIDQFNAKIRQQRISH